MMDPCGDVVARFESSRERTRTCQRAFMDSAGRSWTAKERPIPRPEWTHADEQSDEAGYGVGWLCFVSGELARRLRLYPKEWTLLSDETLAQLCDRARSDPGPD